MALFNPIRASPVSALFHACVDMPVFLQRRAWVSFSASRLVRSLSATSGVPVGSLPESIISGNIPHIAGVFHKSNGDVDNLHSPCIFKFMTEVLSTAGDVIQKLGGPTIVGRMVGRSVQSVVNWRNANKLPADTFLILQAELRERELAAPPSIWGIREQAAQ